MSHYNHTNNLVIDDQDILALARRMQAESGELMRFRIVGLPSTENPDEDVQTDRWDFARAQSQYGRYPILDRSNGRMYTNP